MFLKTAAPPAPAPPASLEVPRFLKLLGATNVSSGDKAILEVAIACLPPPKVEWLLNGKHLLESHRIKVIYKQNLIESTNQKKLRIEKPFKVYRND